MTTSGAAVSRSSSRHSDSARSTSGKSLRTLPSILPSSRPGRIVFLSSVWRRSGSRSSTARASLPNITRVTRGSSAAKSVATSLNFRLSTSSPPSPSDTSSSVSRRSMPASVLGSCASSARSTSDTCSKRAVGSSRTQRYQAGRVIDRAARCERRLVFARCSIRLAIGAGSTATVVLRAVCREQRMRRRGALREIDEAERGVASRCRRSKQKRSRVDAARSIVTARSTPSAAAGPPRARRSTRRPRQPRRRSTRAAGPGTSPAHGRSASPAIADMPRSR